jgi:hypothetical protein
LEQQRLAGVPPSLVSRLDIVPRNVFARQQRFKAQAEAV